MIFTIPFDGNNDKTVKRVEITEEGILYTHDKWYRGNPIAEQEPLLVYEVFGWDLLDTLKKCGFRDACGKVYYGLKDGYMGYLPLYFEVLK